MAYDSSIPQTGHTPAQDYLTIQGNFAQIATSYNTDHVALSGGTPEGFHKQVSLSTYGSAPFAVSGAQSYVYSANNTAAGSQLVYQPSVVAIGVPISYQAFGRVTWNGGSWVNGTGNNFNLNTNSGNKTSPVITFSSAVSSNYYVFLFYEQAAGGSTRGPISVSSKTTSNFIANIQNSADIQTNDSIVIMVY